MEKVLIFGTSGTGQKIYQDMKENCEVIGFLDNDSSKWGRELFPGVKVLGNAECLEDVGEYDRIVIGSNVGLEPIYAGLIEQGVPSAKIDRGRVEVFSKARIYFLRDYASMCDDAPGFDVAEGGVFQGEFAKEIARCFPGRKLYLFDTFEGFDERDVQAEIEHSYSHAEVGYLGNTSEEMVLSRLPDRNAALIRKGYFPETAKGLEDCRFQFVHLDFDLYQPILAGLRFFYPRMRERGVILLHDYFGDWWFAGAREAVRTYEEECGMTLVKIPVGDAYSIAICKV